MAEAAGYSLLSARLPIPHASLGIGVVRAKHCRTRNGNSSITGWRTRDARSSARAAAAHSESECQAQTRLLLSTCAGACSRLLVSRAARRAASRRSVTTTLLAGSTRPTRSPRSHGAGWDLLRRYLFTCAKGRTLTLAPRRRSSSCSSNGHGRSTPHATSVLSESPSTVTRIMRACTRPWRNGRRERAAQGARRAGSARALHWRSLDKYGTLLVAYVT